METRPSDWFEADRVSRKTACGILIMKAEMPDQLLRSYTATQFTFKS
jgi:hypothetical protein